MYNLLTEVLIGSLSSQHFKAAAQPEKREAALLGVKMSLSPGYFGGARSIQKTHKNTVSLSGVIRANRFARFARIT